MPPKYALKDMPAPPKDKFEERIEVGGPYWNLRAIQSALTDEVLEVFVTPSAEEDLRDDLRFGDEELDSFLQTLHVGCCQARSSQWCLEPMSASSSVNDDRIQRLADVYLMGFNKMTGKEQPRAHPRVYIKLAVSAEPPLLIIYSAHYERR